MFVDEVRIRVQAGRGGNGCVSFRREWGVSRGGPDGGRGGRGGHVFIVADDRVKSLAFFRFHPLNRAKNGGHGQGSNRQGKAGKDLILKVPIGTVVKDAARGEILYDFLQPGDKFLVARGGRGGRGNASLATPTNRAPKEAEPGFPGEERELLLELKLIADVGLIGYPNTGKSTLISKISAARPKIADYPFTTLSPNLGVVDIDASRSFVVADIPGLIKGAHLGHGLGINFLRHIERTRLLVHLIDVSPYTGRDPVKDYYIVMEELKAYNPDLLKRRQILVANKIDLLDRNKTRLKSLENLARQEKLSFLAISALKGRGIKKLVATIANELEKISVNWEQKFGGKSSERETG